MEKRIGFILLICCLSIGCAAGPSVQRGAEKVTAEHESPEKYEAKYDVLLERLKTLEQSVSTLRSEVANMGTRLNHVQTHPSLAAYKLPKEVFLCEERFPL